jgi:A/G-specific adenine glycosylase
MLQQTRVETVIPYFERWMLRFPSVQDLAAASSEQVLHAWEGLGYYRRALNLHRGARMLVAEHGGRLPTTANELMRLPGVGRYTGAAIAALAFQQDEIALDGNLRRVLARWIDLTLDPRSSQGERKLLVAAQALLPVGRAAEFNQALMDLGASVCSPRAPACDTCPIASSCLAHRRGTQGQRPVRRERPRIPHRLVAAAVLRRGGRVLIARRPEGKLLGGLWEFPGGKREARESLKDCLRRELMEELAIRVTVGERLGTFHHAYSHYRVSVHAFACSLRRGEPKALEHSQIRWVYPGRLTAYPMGKVDRAIARELQLETVSPDRQRPGPSVRPRKSPSGKGRVRKPERAAGGRRQT